MRVERLTLTAQRNDNTNKKRLVSCLFTRLTKSKSVKMNRYLILNSSYAGMFILIFQLFSF